MCQPHSTARCKRFSRPNIFLPQVHLLFSIRHRAHSPPPQVIGSVCFVVRLSEHEKIKSKRKSLRYNHPFSALAVAYFYGILGLSHSFYGGHRDFPDDFSAKVGRFSRHFLRGSSILSQRGEYCGAEVSPYSPLTRREFLKLLSVQFRAWGPSRREFRVCRIFKAGLVPHPTWAWAQLGILPTCVEHVRGASPTRGDLSQYSSVVRHSEKGSGLALSRTRTVSTDLLARH